MSIVIVEPIYHWLQVGFCVRCQSETGSVVWCLNCARSYCQDCAPEHMIEEFEKRRKQ